MTADFLANPKFGSIVVARVVVGGGGWVEKVVRHNSITFACISQPRPPYTYETTDHRIYCIVCPHGKLTRDDEWRSGMVRGLATVATSVINTPSHWATVSIRLTRSCYLLWQSQSQNEFKSLIICGSRAWWPFRSIHVMMNPLLLLAKVFYVPLLTLLLLLMFVYCYCRCYGAKPPIDPPAVVIIVIDDTTYQNRIFRHNHRSDPSIRPIG